MAAVDTTQRPTVYVNGRQITSPGGLYETVCSSTGDYTLKGYIEMMDGRGQMVRRDFSQPYTVVAPSATVSADLMNVLYAGYENPMSVSIPGVPANKVVASMSGGVLQPQGGQIYSPTGRSGQRCRDYGQCQYGGTYAEDGTVCLSCA